MKGTVVMRKFLALLLGAALLIGANTAAVEFDGLQEEIENEAHEAEDDDDYKKIYSENIKTETLPQTLHVEGNRIYNEDGEEVRLVGACVPSLEWGKGENTLEKTVAMVLDNWNGNIIRLPLSQESWYGRYWYTEDDGDAYRRRVDRIVNMVAARGKYILLDLHEYKIPDENSVNFWKEVSSMYGNHPAVLFDILNEPYGVTWQQWKYGGPVISQKGKSIISPGMQGLVDVIRKNGAKNIIVAGGLDYAYDDRGIAKGYDGLENGYALEEGEGKYRGNGIMYSAHIYPWKVEEQDWEDKVGCIMRDYPIFVGEFGHTNEKVAKYWDNGYYEDAPIWMNQFMNWMDVNGLNYTIWAMHSKTAPETLKNWEYEPTKFNGIYQKYNLSIQENHRPETPAVKDLHPLYDWKKTIDFDETSVDFKVYKENEKEYFATEKVKDGGIGGSAAQLFAFDCTGGTAGAVADIPKDWDLSGISHIAVKIKGDGDMRKISFGLELDDGRQYKKAYPLNMCTEWQTLFFPIDNFKNDYGVFDSTRIKSVFFSVESKAKGSYTIDNIEFGGFPYEESEKITYTEDFSSEKCTVEAWRDNEYSDYDSFTTKWLKNGGYKNTAARGFWFNKTKESYGGQGYIGFPKDWNLTEATYMSFMIKGSEDLDLLFRLRTTRDKDERSGFERRDFEKYCKEIKINGSKWQKVTIKISDFGLSETMDKDMLRGMDIFNMKSEGSGWFVIDDLAFSNEILPVESGFKPHAEAKESEKVKYPLPQLYPDNSIHQECPSLEFKAGAEAVLNIQIHNKTDKTQTGKLIVAEMPDGFTQKEENKTAAYKAYSGYKGIARVYIKVPEGAKGEYKIKIADSENKLVQPEEYTLIIE